MGSIKLINSDFVHPAENGSLYRLSWVEGERVRLTDGQRGWWMGYGPHWDDGVYDYRIRIDGKSRIKREV